MPATSPPAIAPATSTAPIETYQRIAALPSCDRMLTRKATFEKREHDLTFTFKLGAGLQVRSGIASQPQGCLNVVSREIQSPLRPKSIFRQSQPSAKAKHFAATASRS